MWTLKNHKEPASKEPSAHHLFAKVFHFGIRYEPRKNFLLYSKGLRKDSVISPLNKRGGKGEAGLTLNLEKAE